MGLVSRRYGPYLLVMGGKRTIEDRLIDAALRLAAKAPWEDVSFPAILKSARLKLAQVPPGLHTKPALVSAFIKRIDAELLDTVDPDDFAEAGPRDRVFDVLMTRVELLEPHKASVRSMVSAMNQDPLAALSQAKAIDRSMEWALAAAGIDTEGVLGAARRRGLALVWLATFRVWLREDDPNKVMAELDARLAQGEKWLKLLRGRRRNASATYGESGEEGERVLHS